MYELHAVSPEGTASYQLIRAFTQDLAELAKKNYLPVMNDGSKIEIHKLSNFTCLERGDIECQAGAEIVDVYVLYGYVDGFISGPHVQKRFRAELATHLGLHVDQSGASLGALTAEGAEAGRAFLKILAVDGSNAMQRRTPEEDPDFDSCED